jgi:hypothetical protein
MLLGLRICAAVINPEAQANTLCTWEHRTESTTSALQRFKPLGQSVDVSRFVLLLCDTCAVSRRIVWRPAIVPSCRVMLVVSCRSWSCHVGHVVSCWSCRVGRVVSVVLCRSCCVGRVVSIVSCCVGCVLLCQLCRLCRVVSCRSCRVGPVVLCRLLI